MVKVKITEEEENELLRIQDDPKIVFGFNELKKCLIFFKNIMTKTNDLEVVKIDSVVSVQSVGDSPYNEEQFFNSYSIPIEKILELPPLKDNLFQSRIHSIFFSNKKFATFLEFLHMVISLHSRSSATTKTLLLFSLIDFDADECISYFDIFSSFQLLSGNSLSENDCNQLTKIFFKEFGVSEDCKITFELFNLKKAFFTDIEESLSLSFNFSLS